MQQDNKKEVGLASSIHCVNTYHIRERNVAANLLCIPAHVQQSSINDVTHESLRD